MDRSWKNSPSRIARQKRGGDPSLSKNSHPPPGPRYRTRRCRTKATCELLVFVLFYFCSSSCRPCDNAIVARVRLGKGVRYGYIPWKALPPLLTHQCATVRTMVTRAHETDRFSREWDPSCNQNPVDSVFDLDMAGCQPALLRQESPWVHTSSIN